MPILLSYQQVKYKNIIQKSQRCLKVGYVSICHTNRKTKVPTHYSHSPGIYLKGNWLGEAGFDSGRGVTVRILEGCIVLIADCDEVQELREQLYQVRQVVKGIKEAVV
ncbi:TPA: type I addiction module toxin, SymE family [Kluyvera intermedia]|uniref:Toxin SymE, type I toxin-antitoxin system family protein n=2 Tax=Enterobacteriaceae TaxID=543 RepID=A0AAC8QQ76_9ENTR|nr:SymE family type I addiction module toxin [Phytobacter ursingii]HAT2204122.1 type I addiction module toxin, SymE family [Kluyvera intermedia]AKL12522.1 toxin SymE, type I toxin-antitoxin system family protein [Phytobacter ursingii]HAT2514835.1 type I addiction module toxin, SymE family [Kluyvera intermedia]HAT2604410.1 type I addiction module toxin, SymE family [Kluyvera intermedia]HAT2683411.1 type I addiction module toxin, SymE family [Kluyvera intermedia]